MKKFISFVMAGAMVASLVPATAFAKEDVTATAKVVDAWSKTSDWMSDNKVIGSNAPEIQLKVTSADYNLTTTKTPVAEITVNLDNADFTGLSNANVAIRDKDGSAVTPGDGVTTKKEYIYSADKTAQVQAIVEGIVAGTDNNTYVTVETTDAGKTVTEDKKIKEFNLVELKKLSNWDSANVAAEDAAWSALLADKATFNIDAGEDSVDKLKKFYKVSGESFVKVDNSKQGHDTIAWSALTGAPFTDKFTYATLSSDVTTFLDSKALVTVVEKTTSTTNKPDSTARAEVTVAKDAHDDSEAVITVTGWLVAGDVISLDLVSTIDKATRAATVSVSSDDINVTADDLIYVAIESEGIKVSTKKTVDIAEDEVTNLYKSGIVIEPAVDDSYKAGNEVTLKLSSGFEFKKGQDIYVNDTKVSATIDGNELKFDVPNTSAALDKMTVTTKNSDGNTVGLLIVSDSAKSGAVATLKATVKGVGSASVEVAKVVDYKVNLTVDEDEDVPVMWSGTDNKNTGLTADDDAHWSLEVTAKETFPGAWSMRQGFNMNLPEGVYVTGVEIVEAENFYQNGLISAGLQDDKWFEAFYNAYQDGDHKNFEFEKRVFDDVNTTLAKDPASVTFKLELVADPTFEGDVKLTLEGALLDKQDVTIAKFVKPYTVKAEQNDVIIDYRNTKVETPIVVTEAEPGLWKEGSEFALAVDRGDLIQFEDDATFEVNKESDVDIKDTTVTGNKNADENGLKFTIKEESDDTAAVVTIKDMELFMQRNIPAGAYDLKVSTTMSAAYDKAALFAADGGSMDAATQESKPCTNHTGTNVHDKDCIIDDVTDYSNTVKEAFINVVTSGRDQDNLFTTKVVVPVGEKYLVAGENKVELDVAAYISDAGYTMLPVRAISKALGVNTNNVLWNAEARTVTIMYGQRIITMTVGQKTIYVNGSAIPASAAPEIRDGRTFLPLRDLGTALGVTDVTWDAATKTATLNGGTK